MLSELLVCAAALSSAHRTSPRFGIITPSLVTLSEKPRASVKPTLTLTRPPSFPVTV